MTTLAEKQKEVVEREISLLRVFGKSRGKACAALIRRGVGYDFTERLNQHLGLGLFYTLDEQGRIRTYRTDRERYGVTKRVTVQVRSTNPVLWGAHSYRKPGLVSSVSELYSDPQFETFDVNLGYLSGFLGPFPRYGLKQCGQVPFDSHRAGFWLIRTPKWEDSRISHPGGAKAEPGKFQWYSTRTVSLFDGLKLDYEVVNSWLSIIDTGAYRNAGNAEILNEAYKYVRDLIGRIKRYIPEPQRSEYVDYVKSCAYVQGLSIVANGKGTFLRPDIHRLVVSRFNAELWRKAYVGVQQGRTLAFIKADQVTFEKSELPYPESWHVGSESPGHWKIYHRKEK